MLVSGVMLGERAWLHTPDIWKFTYDAIEGGHASSGYIARARGLGSRVGRAKQSLDLARIHDASHSDVYLPSFAKSMSVFRMLCKEFVR